MTSFSTASDELKEKLRRMQAAGAQQDAGASQQAATAAAATATASTTASTTAAAVSARERAVNFALHQRRARRQVPQKQPAPLIDDTNVRTALVVAQTRGARLAADG